MKIFIGVMLLILGTAFVVVFLQQSHTSTVQLAQETARHEADVKAEAEAQARKLAEERAARGLAELTDTTRLLDPGVTPVNSNPPQPPA